MMDPDGWDWAQEIILNHPKMPIKKEKKTSNGYEENEILRHGMMMND